MDGPHLVADGIALAMLEPEGGVVMARRSVQALTAELSRKGVLVRRGWAWKPSAPGRVSALRLMNVWIVGGGSGHGFKHGPAVGEYVTRLMTTNMTAEARFARHSKGTVTSRAVY